MSKLAHLANPVSTMLTASAWTFGVLVYVRSISYTGSSFVLGDTIFEDDRQKWGLHLSSFGGENRVYLHQNDGSDKYVSLPITLNTWIHIHGSFNGSVLRIGKNGGGYRVLTGVGNIANVTGFLNAGYNNNVAGFHLDGEILTAYPSPATVISDATLLTITNELSTIYGMTLQTVPVMGYAVMPDIIWGRTFGTQHQRTPVNPIAPPVSALTPSPRIEFPASITRLAMAAAVQLAVTEIPPFPDSRKVQYAEAIAPVAIDRRTMPAAQQMFVTEISPRPERPVPFSDAVEPDYINRRVFLTAHQMHVGTTNAPPEQMIAFSSAIAPDTTLRRTLPTALYPVLASQPHFPDPRTVQFSDVVAPVAIDRRTMHASLQPFVTGEQPQVEETVVLGDQPMFPVAIDRLVYRTANQQAFVIPTFPDPRRAQFVDAVAPAAIDRRTMLPAMQQAVTGISPSPVVLISVLFTSFQDAIDRRTFAPAQQQAFVTSLQPEEKTPFVAGISPVAIDRRTMLAAQQMAVGVQPIFPDARVVQFSGVVAQETIDRRTMLAASQQAFVMQLFPDARRVPFTDALSPVSARPAVTVAYLQPPYSAPVAPPGIVVPPIQYWAIMPAWLPGPRPQQPQSYVAPPQQANVFAPTHFAPYFPAAIQRLSPMHVGYTAPPTHAPLFAPTWFAGIAPDWLPPKRVQQPQADVWNPLQFIAPAPLLPLNLGLAQISRPVPQTLFAGYSVLPIRDRQSPAVQVIAPETIDRRTMLPAMQQAIAVVLRDRSTPIATPSFPDVIDRRTMLTAQQSAFVIAQRDRKSPLESISFPDRITQLTMPTAHQQASVIPNVPIITFSAAFFPERIDRRTFAPAQQQVVTEIGPKPERTALITDVGFFYSILRPFMLACNQQSFVSPYFSRFITWAVNQGATVEVIESLALASVTIGDVAATASMTSEDATAIAVPAVASVATITYVKGS